MTERICPGFISVAMIKCPKSNLGDMVCFSSQFQVTVHHCERSRCQEPEAAVRSCPQSRTEGSQKACTPELSPYQLPVSPQSSL